MTRGAGFNSSTDADEFMKDDLVIGSPKGAVNNVIELMKLDAESQLKGSWCQSRSIS